MKNAPKVLILHATGTNRDLETAEALRQAGGDPVIVHVNELRQRPAALQGFQMLVLPGGFSYGDALGAGRLWANDLRWLFHDELSRFVEAGKPVLGICNGFQALVKSGWLPGPPQASWAATLTVNESNRFECRWVWLEPVPDSPCVFTRGMTERLFCPVAHGEGRFVVKSPKVLQRLVERRQVALCYVAPNGDEAGYPDNPNGSVANIAGICNEAGTVMGLMPHPEDHTYSWQRPSGSGAPVGLGLELFARGIAYAAGV